MDEAFVVPAFEGGGAHAEAGGGVGEVEEASGGEPLFAGSEPVVDADVVDDAGVEGLSGAGEDPGLVELVGDAGFGVVVEEAVDLGDHGRRCAPGFGGGQADGDVEAVGLAAAEAKVHCRRHRRLDASARLEVRWRSGHGANTARANDVKVGLNKPPSRTTLAAVTALAAAPDAPPVG